MVMTIIFNKLTYFKLSMKTFSKLSVLSLGLLVPALAVPLFVKAADVSANSSVNWQNGKNSVMGRGMHASNGMKNKLTDEQRSKLLAEKQAKYDAVQKAINANDYNAWLDAVGKDSPIAKQITSDKFATFIEAHKLMNQAQEKFKSIGLEKGMGMGMGLGRK